MKPLSNQQRLNLVNSEQLYDNYIQSARAHRAYIFGMRWKRIRDVEYLFRGTDWRGNGKTLGRRTAEMEEILGRFTEGRERSCSTCRSSNSMRCLPRYMETSG